ncbi:MAG: carboxyl-terminal processing protease [Chloroflexota bacterium]|jgi:carboxyl-terminal processing protease|nr:carboxyl-terminal processing protease [Chloroflexota bacterium]
MVPAETETAASLDVPLTAVRGPGRRRIRALPIAIVVVAVLAGSALFLSGYTMGRQAAAEPGTPVSEDAAFQPFWDAYHTITERYAGGPVDRNTLIQGAIRGMIGALGDPYSSYLTSEEYRQSLQGISGQFEGIGAEIATQARDGTQGCPTLGPDCHLLILGALAGSPAERAGLTTGDLVLETDGVSLDGLTVDAARDRIRGPKGTTVTLTIQRGSGTPFKVAITRDVVQQKEVDTRLLAGGTVGYVRLVGFSDAAADELTAAFAAHVKAGRTKLILDLRGNPGGYVTAARKVASQFIGSGVIFWEQDANGVQTPTEATPDGAAIDPKLQVVCLIDGGSASASEIVAGALQDSKRATLVGVQSFGKGTVQQWQELSGEGGAFKLTIARWLTPDKRWIHQKGLTPDVMVTLPNPVPAGSDPILDKALEVLGASAQGDLLRDAA